MRMIRWICGHTRLDSISNEIIIGKLGVAFIQDKMREVRVRWFGHIRRWSMDVPVRKRYISQTIKGVGVDRKGVGEK